VGALEDRRKAPAYAAMAAALYASVIAAASRTGAILVTAEILLIVFTARRRSRALTFGLLAAFAVLFTAIAGWDVLWRRFLLADPFSDRREFFLSSLAMIRDVLPWASARNLVHGISRICAARQRNARQPGAQRLGAVGRGRRTAFSSADALDRGALGASAFRTLWGIGVVAVFLHSLVDYPLQRPALAGFFFVFLAVMESARELEKNLDFVFDSYRNTVSPEQFNLSAICGAHSGSFVSNFQSCSIPIGMLLP
jgi:hypothetical protein